MKKIKIFALNSGAGWMSMGEVDYAKLENQVNEFVADPSRKINDIQYKIETSGTIMTASVMVVYEEV